MKKFKKLKNKNDLYISFIYFLVACSILANFSQFLVFKYRFGNFHFGEMIILMFNDSYTGYFAFPFLLGFILIIQSPIGENIFFTITRYSNRKEFYKNTHFKFIKSVIFYVISICIFSVIVGMGSSNFSIEISDSAKKFSEMYLFENFETNILIFEIFKIIILQSLLFYFFTLIYSLLIQFRISQSIVFAIYSSILIVMAGISLGFFGNLIKSFSLFSIASSVYAYDINYFLRVGILIFIDIILLLINFKIFENKDITLPKGSKQYQNE